MNSMKKYHFVNLSILLRSLFLIWFLVDSAASIGQEAKPDVETNQSDQIKLAASFVNKYCVSCHGPVSQEADRRFDQILDSDAKLSERSSDQREQWREILDRLNLADMPPEDAKLQPSEQERLGIIDLLTNQLSQKSKSASEQPTILRRLNRTEYDLSVRQLLGLETMLKDPTSSFSPDETKEGFSNVGDSLIVSDFLMNRYLNAADQYIDAAIEKATASKSTFSRNFKPPFFNEGEVHDGLNVDGEYQHIRENATDRGGYLWLQKLSRGVPTSGLYKIRIHASAINREHPYKPSILKIPKSDPLIMSLVVANASQSRNPKTNHATDRTLATFEVADNEPDWYEVEVWIDKGYLIKLGYPNGPRQIKYQRHQLMRNHRDSFPKFLTEHCPVFSNMHPDYDPEKAPALVKTFLAEQEELRKAGKPYAVFGVAHLIHTREAWGTFYSEYQGPRIRVFEIQLSKTQLSATKSSNTLATVDALIDETFTDRQAINSIRSFAKLAARRPLNEKQIAPILTLYQSARKSSSVNEAARLAYKSILCSPFFIYHRNRNGKLDQFELASRLSYFLTNAPPDNELQQLAQENKLDASAIREQTNRLLNHESNRRFVESFADAWLKLSKLGTMLPDFHEHPDYYNERLESAMREETVLFLQDAIKQNRPTSWLVDADQTFLNAPLARLYGIEGVDHLDLRPHKFSKLHQLTRGGLLGQASILTASANGIDTSPVIRGIWVLECILGTPPSSPPPDVEPLEPDTRGATTIREQLSKHRDVASCRHCHRRIDPLGFALESFDEIGRFRSNYVVGKKKKSKIETAGTLPSGEKFSHIAELKKILATKANLLDRNLVSKLLIHATGRIHNPDDAADVLAICRPNSKNESNHKNPNGMRELIHRLIASDAFHR
jgi:hypothetical protein